MNVSVLLKVIALIFFVVAWLSGAAILTASSDWLSWQALLPAGLAFWVGSELV